MYARETSEAGVVAVRWYRLPLIWMGAAILLACLVGCISMVVLAQRHPDEPLPVDSDQLLRMPARTHEPSR